MDMQPESRHYGVKTFYGFVNDLFSNYGDMKEAQKHERVSKDFKERIMLAVTKVSGCRFCSYIHTKDALKAGMEEGEIKNILSGELGDIPEEQSVAVMFAQHYAETTGNYDPEAYKRVVNTYGEDATRDIMAFIRAIMVGNTHAKAFEALFYRLKLRPESGSTIWREIGIAFGMFIFVPFVRIKTALSHKN